MRPEINERRTEKCLHVVAAKHSNCEVSCAEMSTLRRCSTTVNACPAIGGSIVVASPSISGAFRLIPTPGRRPRPPLWWAWGLDARAEGMKAERHARRRRRSRRGREHGWRAWPMAHRRNLGPQRLPRMRNRGWGLGSRSEPPSICFWPKTSRLPLTQRAPAGNPPGTDAHSCRSLVFLDSQAHCGFVDRIAIA